MNEGLGQDFVLKKSDAYIIKKYGDFYKASVINDTYTCTHKIP